ncbi:hypothetical protein PRIPAC_71229 [Pristionchus pacificus]|nr:hypothetical protein PRIPAC_71229 [Pristionchus pacificus]
MHSPVFNRMFFCDFIERNKNEVEIKEINFEEFVDLLLVIFPDGHDISDTNVLHIAKLADRFLIKKVLHWCEKHLIASNKFTVEKKLQIADAYRFPKLMHNCLQIYTTVQQLKVFQNSPAYKKFSNDTKAVICDHIMMKLL